MTKFMWFCVILKLTSGFISSRQYGLRAVQSHVDLLKQEVTS